MYAHLKKLDVMTGLAGFPKEKNGTISHKMKV